MPSLIPFTKRDDGSQDDQNIADPTRVWVLVAIVAGTVFIASSSVFLIVWYIRRKQYRQAKHDNPYLTRKEFAKKRYMSDLDRMEEEEMQRSAMIRKSLATRSTWSSNRNSQVETLAPSTDGDEDEEAAAAAGLKDDWKEWEAKLQRERSNSADRHPSAQDVTASLLPVPPQSRPRSSGTPGQSPSPLLVGRSGPPHPITATLTPSEGSSPSTNDGRF